MTSFRIALPVLDPAMGTRAMASLGPLREHVILIDNAPATGWVREMPWHWRHRATVVGGGGHNLGVPVSWNIAAQVALDDGADLLVLMSQAVELLDDGASLLAAVAEPAEWGFDVAGAGWHLIAFTRATLTTVGPFDEGFYPGYFEDTDYLYRMGLAGLPSPRENGRSMPFRTVLHRDHGSALMVSAGVVRPNWGRLQGRYHAKWGGIQGEERFTSPWDSGRPGWWWPDSRFGDGNPWAQL